MGKYNDALWNFSKALEIFKNVFREENPQTANVYNNIGLVYGKMGKNDALKYCSKALKIYERVLPSEDPKIANLHLYIGALLLNFDRYKEAKEHLQKALDIYKKEPSKHQESILGIFEGLTVIDTILRGGGAPKGEISFKFNKWN